MSFRPGQWVSFDLTPDLDPIKDLIQKTADGTKGVGIYVKPGRVAALDGDGKALGVTEEHVSPVGPDGKDLFALNGVEVVRAKLNPAKLTGLAGITNKLDLPASRIAHQPADWQPTP